ncbi:MAG: hypothetical protein H6739_24170 [Alphaproteobacteria bacterium]|nr:hypothetical protein [Alphaproteobacteria bacterium]
MGVGRTGALLALLLAGCAPRYTLQGVVEASGREVEVTDPDGKRWRLFLDTLSQPVSHLDACTVEVTGPRLGRRVYVRDWTVLAAADGSAPYVGRLTLRGSNLVLEDRNSGSTFVLEERSAAPLKPYAGQSVMVIGFIIAPHVVQVVGWRPLEG